jgi:flagellar biosynthetic protein FliP
MGGETLVEGARALALVLALLGALHMALRWLDARRGLPRRGLHVVETCALGARKRLHVVEVDGERLLVAASESGVSLLRKLPATPPDPMPAPEETAPAESPARGRLRRLVRPAAIAGCAALLLIGLGVTQAEAADGAGLVISLEGNDGEDGLSPALEMLALLTLLSAAPSILLMATCFTRVVIVLAFVRQAIGVQHLPPNQVLIGLAIFVTFYVMAPLGEQVRLEAYEPYKAREITIEEAGERSLAPLRQFMMHHTRESDLGLFLEMSAQEAPPSLEDVPTSTLLPAFLISELRTAFEIGFVIFLPFLVIDLVVSSMLISMGMIVLPPMVVALPFKIMLFVLADGWHLVLGSVVAGLR